MSALSLYVKAMKPLRYVIVVSLLMTGVWCQAAVYQSTESFLTEAFKDRVPKPKMIWFTGEVKQRASQILSHPPTVLRTRYWQDQQRSVWILEEIGKEKPITTGIVIQDGKIEKVRVLVFRESRGWEVKRQAFTDQFENAYLREDMELSQPIDGITGATLSVRALKKLARLALYLDSRVRDKTDAKEK